MNFSKEPIKMVDCIEWTIKKNGKIVKEHLAYDLLTNAGFAGMAALILTDVGGTPFDYIGIGSGTIAANVVDTTLGTEAKRKAAVGTRVTTSVANDTAQWVATFSSADTLSGTMAWSEVGILNGASGSTLLMRQVFTAETLDWDAGDSVQITVKIQFKQGA